jgi:hypothetical protein
MEKNYNKFRLVDQAGKKDLIIEVNWNEKEEETNGSKVLKLTYPNGENAYVKREYFNSLLFVLGTPEEQQKMIPQKLTKARWYETVLSVKATKDIKKGENITFPIKLTMPVQEEEIIGKIAKGRK